MAPSQPAPALKRKLSAWITGFEFAQLLEKQGAAKRAKAEAEAEAKAATAARRAARQEAAAQRSGGCGWGGRGPRAGHSRGCARG